ncbi:MAG: phospholipase D family protein, partial [Gammaproteobacteria bacterium]
MIPHQDQSGVVLVNSGQDAFSSRIALTDAAERTIDAQYYIWNSDLTGRLLAERLLDAANRGVRVRLLLDDFGLGAGEKDNALIALAAHPKIELRVYNPL